MQNLNYYEESFAVYETGIDLFQFTSTKNNKNNKQSTNDPADAHQLWTNYLTQFKSRYKGTQMTRTRELYNRCLSEITIAATESSTDDSTADVNRNNVHEITIQYGKWE